MNALPMNLALRRQLESRLDDFERIPHEDGELRRAAVTLLIVGPGDASEFDRDEIDFPTPARDEACFVITRRTAKLRNHPRQWALPGGRLDEGETAVEAALRETREEVGLSLDESSVLALLDDYPTRSGFIITPVVVWGGIDAELEANPHEVEHVYRVPLRMLERPEVPRLRSIPESDRPVISIPMLKTNIHAPTAAVLYQLREVALLGRSTRVAHFEQPVFAWR
jgi:8-oxo-dGTP pyrophosphatase MutT (NUDIX family)